MHAIPERLRGVITTRRYTNPHLPYLDGEPLVRLGDYSVSVKEQKDTSKTKGLLSAHIRQTALIDLRC